MRAAVICFALCSTSAAFAQDEAAPAKDEPTASSGLSLAEAYQKALIQNEAVRIGEQNISTARIQWQDTWSQMRPKVGISGNATLRREIWVPPAGGQPGFVGQAWYQAGASARITQPVLRFDFAPALEAGRLGAESFESSLTRAKEELMRDVALVFIDVLLSRQLVVLGRSTVKRTEAQLQNAQSRVKAGGALKTSELLAALDMRRAQIQLVTAERTVEEAEVAFHTLIGEQAPDALVLPASVQLPTLDEAVQHLPKRADIGSFRLLAHQSRSLEMAARRKPFWPMFDVEGAVSFSNEQADYIDSYSIVGLLTIPLYDGGSEYAAIELQQIQTKIYELEEKRLIKTAADELQRALAQVSAAQRQSELAEAQLKQATQNYGLVETQFRLGAVTFLEVTSAQAALAEAETLKLTAVYDRERAAYAFLYAAGLLSLE